LNAALKTGVELVKAAEGGMSMLNKRIEEATKRVKTLNEIAAEDLELLLSPRNIVLHTHSIFDRIDFLNITLQVIREVQITYQDLELYISDISKTDSIEFLHRAYSYPKPVTVARLHRDVSRI